MRSTRQEVILAEMLGHKGAIMSGRCSRPCQLALVVLPVIAIEDLVVEIRLAQAQQLDEVGRHFGGNAWS